MDDTPSSTTTKKNTEQHLRRHNAGRLFIASLGVILVLLTLSLQVAVSDVFSNRSLADYVILSLPENYEEDSVNATLAQMHRSSWCSNSTQSQKNKCPQIGPNEVEDFRHREIQGGIQRIYYINLDKNVVRRQRMENALANQTTLLHWHRDPLPYDRVPAVRGDEPPSACHSDLQDPDRCNGLIGITKSNLGIMRFRNVTGLTLIMEDDFLLRNLSLMEEALAYIPQDWDIIRFDCVDYEIRQSFDYIEHPDPNFLVFRANFVRPCNGAIENCNYCGGAFAMLWRESSLSTLYNIWTRSPAKDLDCRLGWDTNIRSYCFNTRGRIGEHAPPGEEFSDIPKNGPPPKPKPEQESAV